MKNADEEFAHLQLKTAKGRKYWNFRVPGGGGKLIKLPGEKGSPEFRRVHAACMRAITKQPVEVARPERAAFERDSVGAAIEVYLASFKFGKLKPGTRSVYRNALGVLGGYLGTAKLSGFDVDSIDLYSEKIARDHSASTADAHVALLSLLWQCCRKHPQFNLKGSLNPTTGAERRYKVKAPHKPWPDDAEERFEATAPWRLKLAKLLLHFSAQRGGDCVKLKWTDYDGRGLYVTPEKTDGNAEPEQNYHLCTKPLREALDRSPREADTILTNAWGRPYANATTLSHSIRSHLIRIGLAVRGTKTLTMHGLRKNAASDVGSLLLGAAGIKSVTGQKSDKMANYYAQHHDKRAVNAKVVEAWDAKLAGDAEKKTAMRRAQIRRVK